ncbi:hypothetical protein J32TS6_40140 [Virgibacillus pantothenticus]|uniref:Uncharacterized protein n=1 Tax=Virgibacillus pantothenticus TaxID=1473 RepID=A0A0L0QQ86_VIRPA|nr:MULTISPECIES: hypothetical protein [Virgibacillus]API90833.1 hypothetical protein BKP57_02575 [Virgibacillus sp. 6R]KNE20780.1 hypothetical protein AFK71_20900 [Virgibacillus pantothenticus]MBS7426732.1 hypothetical protein [Virgibacillus sp. 19R1-5]MBU8566059.1 hypothetical protein [Virgibacillus pantothenticus]MBU8602768.1 hypothetical protein [Virgibacillus pantothenticus]
MNRNVYLAGIVFAIAMMVIFSSSSVLFFDKVNWILVILFGAAAYVIFTVSIIIVLKLKGNKS